MKLQEGENPRHDWRFPTLYGYSNNIIGNITVHFTEKESKKIEIGVIGLVLVLLMFLNVNFDPMLGMVFSIMALFTGWAVVSDKHISKKFQYPLVNRVPQPLVVFTLLMSAFALYLAVSSIVTMVLVPGAEAIGGILRLVSQETIPALHGSARIRFFVFGVLIPVVETLAFVRITEFGGDILGIDYTFDLDNIRLHALIVVVSAMFALFHLSVAMAQSAPTLLLSFVFMMVSLWLVAFRKQSLEAVLLHIFNNSFVYAIGAGVPQAMAVVVSLGG